MTLNLSQPFGPTFQPGRAFQGDHVFFDDFITGVSEPGHKISADNSATCDWLVQLPAGTNYDVQDDGHGGFLRCVTGATDDTHLISMQLNGEAFSYDGKELYMEARVRSSSILADVMIAVTPADVAVIAARTDGAGLLWDGTAVWTASLEDADSADISTTLLGAPALVAATWTILAFHVIPDGTGPGGVVNYFIDGTRYGSLRAPIFTIEDLSPVIEVRAANSSGAVTFDVDYVLVANARDEVGP